MIVVADAAFPRKDLFFGEFNELRIDERLEGFVLLRRVPVLVSAHHEERNLWKTDLGGSY